MKSIFKSEETQKAFEKWITPYNGINPHPLDDERFYSFVKVYIKMEESVTREVFSKEAKRYTHTTKNYKRGICQKYYDKLNSIIEFTRIMKIKI